MKKEFETLEIEKILKEIEKYIKTTSGYNLIKNISTFSNLEKIQNEYSKLHEIIYVIDTYNDIPLSSELNIYECLKSAKKGSYLDEYSLNLIKNELILVKEIISYFKVVTEEIPNIRYVISKIKTNDNLIDLIDSKIDIENNIKDNATSKLKDIRNNLKSIDNEIHKVINNLVKKYSDILIGDNYVLREGKYVLPVSTFKKASVPGYVLDVSDSGQTSFIEPTPIIELENNRRIYELKEKEEVNSILKELTIKVLKEEELLLTNNRIIGQLDLLVSKAKYAKEIKATIPILSNKQEMCFYNARHPLLALDKVIGNNFILNEEHPLMLISGPNAGGKTVALKTVATLTYMVKLGLAIPVDENSKVGYFNRIFIDIGDNQSIENNLSTFSAQVNDLAVILKLISSRDLVVLDEICNGTDPKEGDSLAIAIVRYLLSKKCIALVTSHYPLLKKYGLSNQKVVNASFIFDQEKLEPTFKMTFGISGKSFGFKKKKKFGLNGNIVNDAMKIYKKNYRSETDLKIEQLEKLESELQFKEEQLNKKENELSSLEANLTIKEKKISEKEEKLRNKKIDELDSLIENKIDQMNDIYDDFIQNKKNLKEAEKNIENLSLAKKVNQEFKVGDFVYNKELNIQGKIKEINKNKIIFTSDDGFTLSCLKDKLEIIDPPKKPLKATHDVDKEFLNQTVLSSSLNLVGYHIDEGLNALDDYLDKCILKNLKEVRIIHGYGSGQLKTAIHNHLKNIKFVKSFRLCNELEGGGGATLVTLK